MPNGFWETPMFVADGRTWDPVGPGLATPLAETKSGFLSALPTSQVHPLLNRARQIMNHFFSNIESD